MKAHCEAGSTMYSPMVEHIYSGLIVIKNFSSKENLNPEIELYPNPTKSEIKYYSKSEIMKIEVFYLLGHNIKNIAIDMSQKSINTSVLLNGIYMLRIETKNREVVVKRFIKE